MNGGIDLETTRTMAQVMELACYTELKDEWYDRMDERYYDLSEPEREKFDRLVDKAIKQAFHIICDHDPSSASVVDRSCPVPGPYEEKALSTTVNQTPLTNPKYWEALGLSLTVIENPTLAEAFASRCSRTWMKSYILLFLGVGQLGGPYSPEEQAVVERGQQCLEVQPTVGR